MQARGGRVEQQVDGEARAALLLAAQKHTVVAQHRFAPGARAVQPALTGGHQLRLLVDEHAVADLFRQTKECVLMQLASAQIGGAVALRLLGSLLEQPLRVRTRRFVRRRHAAGEPEAAAQMVAGAAALLNERKLLRRIQAAAEAALDIVPILPFTLIGAQMRPQRVGRAHHAVLSRGGGASHGQLVRSDDLDRHELGEQRRPFVAEMKAERVLFMNGPVELQILRKRRKNAALQLAGTERSGAAQCIGQSLLPRCEQRRALTQHALPVRGLEGIDQLVLFHPLLPRELVFGREKLPGVGTAQLFKHRPPGQFLFVHGVFQRKPRKVVKDSLPRIARPAGKQPVRHLVAEPFVHQSDDTVHIKVRFAV